VKGKYFQPITATAPKITTTTEIDLTLSWSSKKSYIILLLPVKSIHDPDPDSMWCFWINV
jgi:hypothetical protein